MGIFDFVKQGVREMMIARPDEKKDLLCYKHPDQTVPMFSQLTVDADEAAVFFRDGSVVGTLRTAGAGQRHSLSSQNIPFLGGLVDKMTGGNVFVTDLFFVTTRPIYNVRFGGELGYLEDPMLGEMVTPRIYGTMAFQVVNPEAFIVKYTGVRATSAQEQEQWIKGLFMNSVKTVVGEICDGEGKSFLQLMGLQQRFKEAFVARAPDLNEIGVRIVDVGEFAINLSDDDERTLKNAQAEIGEAKRAARKAKIKIDQAQAEAQARQFELDQKYVDQARHVQNLAGGNYQAYAAGQAMIGAGQGMAQGGGSGGGSMSEGAGLGVGFGMAQAFAQGMQGGGAAGQQGTAPQAAAPQATASAGGTVSCGSCNASVPQGKFCAECGSALAPKPQFCSACGTPASPGSKFCSGCGTAIAV